jgi:hypothetical protein
VAFRQDAKAASRRSAAQKAGRASEAGPSASSIIKKEESVSPVESSTSDVTLHGSVSPTLSDSRTSLSGETICASPTISPAQHATCFFISNYILVPQQGSTHGFMDFLVPLLASEPSNGHFSHAFNACAYAALSNRYRTSDNRFGDEALSQYTRALSTTHAALRDPKKSTTDGTLASVLLLGLFENLTAKQMGMFAWGSHIEGAIQLVKARGRKQLRTKTGLILFIAVRTQLIIHSLTSGKAPTMGVDWWLDEAVYVRYSAAVQKLALEVSELRAYVTHLMTTVARTPDNIKLMKDAIQRARAIDDEHIEWMKNLPEYWAPTTVAWEDKVPHGDYTQAEVYPGRVDFYDDVYIASVWNLARVSRVILASLTVRCAAWVCAPVDYRTTPEYATAARICVDTITDVIASVPYQLGWQPRGYTKHGMSSFPCGDEHAIKGLAGYFLTWPLGTLRGLDFTTDAQRTWIVGRLNYIANTLGVRYATILAQVSCPPFLNLHLASSLTW